MRKLFQTALFTLPFSMLLIGYASADVAAGPMIATLLLVPALTVAVLIVVIVLIIKYFRSRNK